MAVEKNKFGKDPGGLRGDILGGRENVGEAPGSGTGSRELNGSGVM